MINKNAVLRVARPTNDLQKIAKMYAEGLNLKVLGKFEDHDGFDGFILGHEKNSYHLEFSQHKGSIVDGAPTKDNLLVFYFDDENEWKDSCVKMLEAGFKNVKSFNPYWDNCGSTFEDPEGYRVVLQNRKWDV